MKEFTQSPLLSPDHTSGSVSRFVPLTFEQCNTAVAETMSQGGKPYFELVVAYLKEHHNAREIDLLEVMFLTEGTGVQNDACALLGRNGKIALNQYKKYRDVLVTLRGETKTDQEVADLVGVQAGSLQHYFSRRPGLAEVFEVTITYQSGKDLSVPKGKRGVEHKERIDFPHEYRLAVLRLATRYREQKGTLPEPASITPKDIFHELPTKPASGFITSFLQFNPDFIKEILDGMKK